MDDKKWIKINRQACSIICLCLAKDHKYSVMRETLAKKLWEALKEKYMKKSIENRLYIKKKLYRFTYAPGMSMNDHVNSFNKILADLLNLDEKFEGENKVLLLFNSFPDEYGHLITTLLHGKDNVIFDPLYNALLLECNSCTSFALFTYFNIDVLHLIIVIYLYFIFVGAILLIGAKIDKAWAYAVN